MVFAFLSLFLQCHRIKGAGGVKPFFSFYISPTLIFVLSKTANASLIFPCVCFVWFWFLLPNRHQNTNVNDLGVEAIINNEMNFGDDDDDDDFIWRR